MTEHRDRLVDLALEERIGGAVAPDMTARVVGSSDEERRRAIENVALASSGSNGGRRFGWLAAAAVLLLGIGIVFAVYASLPGDETPRETTTQDPVDEIVRPKTIAEFRELARQVTAISFRSLRADGHDLTASKAEYRIDDAKGVRVFLDDLLANLHQTDPAGWDHPNRIELRLKSGKFIRVAVDRDRRVSISGLGDCFVGGAIAQQMRDLVGVAEWDARRELGIVLDPMEIAMLHGEAFSADLETLYVSNVTDENAVQLARFTKLHRLEIRDSPDLGVGGLSRIAELVSIEELNWRWADCGDAMVAQIARLPRLRRLELERFAARSGRVRHVATGEGFEAFAQHRALRHLDLSWAGNLTDRGLTAIAAIPNLEELELDGFAKFGVTDAPLTRLGAAVNLRVLRIDDTKLWVDGALAEFGGLTKLERLTLSDTNVTDEGLAHLRGHAALQDLRLDRCKGITDASVETFNSFPALRVLRVSQCPLTGPGIARLSPELPLEELDLRNVKLGDSGADSYEWPILPKLRWLELSFCDVGDRLMLRLAQHEALRNLGLAGNDRITDAGLRTLARMVRLERLDLNVCDGFTGDGVAVLRFMLPDAELRLPNRFR